MGKIDIKVELYNIEDDPVIKEDISIKIRAIVDKYKIKEYRIQEIKDHRLCVHWKEKDDNGKN